jgi:hypothetical protein
MPGLPDPEELTYGAVIGLVHLEDIVPFAEVAGQPFAEGPLCWIFRHARALRPFPCAGMPGLFTVELPEGWLDPDAALVVP